MKLRRTLAILLCVLLLSGLLAGCSANTMDSANGDVMYDSKYEVEYATSAGSSLTTSEETVKSSLPENQKLITTLYMDAETEDMDALLAQIDERIAELGGYMEEQEIYNGSSYYSGRTRYANLTIRIPAESLDLFVDQVSQVSNIISKTRSTENVTLSYVATQSRITALETEEARLLELLAKAETMDDLLLIESRLTEVRAELEQVTSQLRLYDNLVDYSTIHLSIDEVREYTQVVEEPETVWERVSTGFMESLENLGDGLTELFIFIVTRLPYLIPAAVIALIVVLILVLKNRKGKKKETPPQNEQPK